jgi:hypothetical protein
VNLSGELITSLPISSKDSLGVEIKQPVAMPGLISFFEEDDARIQAHYNLQEWKKLSYNERASEVAHYRIRAALEYQRNKKSAKAMDG